MSFKASLSFSRGAGGLSKAMEAKELRREKKKKKRKAIQHVME